MKRFLLAASTALLLTACDVGMDPAVDTLDMPEVADGTLSEDTMKRVTERLSSDEFEGRAPGTPGEEKTVAYLIEEFEKAGLEPGNNGSWVQEVPLVEITGKDYAPLTIGGRRRRSDRSRIRQRLGRGQLSRGRADHARG